jgi:hypothetical protein
MIGRVYRAGTAILGGMLIVAGAAGAASAQTAGNVVCNGCVGTRDVENGALTGVDVRDGSIAGIDLQNGSVTGADLKDGSVGNRDLGPSVFPAVGITLSGTLDNFTADTFTSVLTTTLVAPASGFVLITATVNFEDDLSLAGASLLRAQVTMDGTVVTEPGTASTNEAQDVLAAVIPLSVITPVTKGSRTLELQLRETEAGAFVNGASLTAVFLKTGSVSASRTGARGPARQPELARRP